MQITVDDIFCHFQTQQTMLSSLIIDLNSKSNIYLLDVAFQENLSFFFLLQSTLRDPQRVFKVVFLGNSAVGKSSFIHHYCSGHFPNNLASTVGERR